MRLTWVLIVAAFVVFVGLVSLVIAGRDPQPALSEALLQRQPDLEHGAYVARLGDCTACHTKPGGEEMTGGLAFATPVGAIYASNITPDVETGIGKYTLKDFIRVMRFGIATDHRDIYPAMPYTAFAKTSDIDLQDLYAYLMQEKPVRQDNRASDIIWPLSMRWPLAFWNLLFLDTHRYKSDETQDAVWNRGAYLVQGFGHCGTCHTPRGIFFQEKDSAGKTAYFLAGSSLDGSSPINLRNRDGDGLGAWSVAEIAETLKTGRNALAAVHGPMTEVVEHSTQYMSDADAKAIATYLKSLQPAGPAKNTYASNGDTYKAIMAGHANDTGARIYMDSCAACHRLDGQGYDHAFPRLAGNASVLADNTDSLIAVILQGNRLPSTPGAPSPLAMPPFDWRYDDTEIAELASFVRNAWGNHGTAVKSVEVKSVRAALHLEEAKR